MKVKELEIDKSEAHSMAVAIANVQRHYPGFTATQQTMDWIALLTVLCLTYGTRFSAIKIRKSMSSRRTTPIPSPGDAFLSVVNNGVSTS
jgi:hypothetical protein